VLLTIVLLDVSGITFGFREEWKCRRKLN